MTLPDRAQFYYDEERADQEEYIPWDPDLSSPSDLGGADDEDSTD